MIRYSNTKARRKEQNLKRKNFLPTLLLIILLWLLLFGLIYFVDPTLFGALPAFFILVFASLLFTFSLIFANSRQGLILTSTITIFLILSYLGVGNILNVLLLSGVAISIELYLARK
ncbi:MAG: hypothetical protein AAB622_00730 [Patescibacteria group bacterium]